MKVDLRGDTACPEISGKTCTSYCGNQTVQKVLFNEKVNGRCLEKLYLM